MKEGWACEGHGKRSKGNGGRGGGKTERVWEGSESKMMMVRTRGVRLREEGRGF